MRNARFTMAAILAGGCLAIAAAGQAAEGTSTVAVDPQMQSSPLTRTDVFPIAVWLQRPDNAGRYKDLGVNLYVGLWRGPNEEQLAELRRQGMHLICGQNEYALTQLDNPMIVAWMHGDEPDNAQPIRGGGGYGPPIDPARIVEQYRRIKDRDPSRPVLLNLGQGVAWDGWHGRGVRTNHPEDYPEYIEGCDIASFDIYPAVHDRPAVAGKLWYVARGVDRLKRWAGDRRSVWNCIECTHIGNAKVKPTPAQVKAEVWMSIIHGSQGLIYFCHQFEPTPIEAGLLADAEMSAAVKRINEEIHRLAPAIRSPSVPQGLTVACNPVAVSPELAAAMDTGPVAAVAKRQGNDSYVFAVRMEDAPVRATFQLRDKFDGEVEVVGEDRKLPLEKGKFEDEFAGYAVHLYRVEGGVDPP